jgi:Xaa-Pro aminopeptidase
MRENMTAASVDIAARDVISHAGYAEAFTHRVGHGIGIKGPVLAIPVIQVY